MPVVLTSGIMGMVRSINNQTHSQGLPNESAFMAVGIDVKLFWVAIFVAGLDINKILSTRLINSNTCQYAATFLTTEALL